MPVATFGYGAATETPTAFGYGATSGGSPVTTIFSDNFDAGNLSAWSATNVDSGNSATATTGSKRNGTHGVDFTMTATWAARVRKDSLSWPGTNKLAYQWSLQEVMAMPSSTSAYVAMAYDSTLGVYPWVLIRTSSVWTLRLRKRDGSGNVDVNFSTAPTLSTWCTLEVLYDCSGSAPVLTAYLNNSQVAQCTDPSASGTVSHPGQFYLGYAAISGTLSTRMYCDDMLIADGLIGAGSGLPTPDVADLNTCISSGHDPLKDGSNVVVELTPSGTMTGSLSYSVHYRHCERCGTVYWIPVA